ncbi:F-box protein MET30 [Phytophthora citrophthora]|uniref:F-box protein MET30 n=1 Tax=Phytophthora citrophthora TaxID=4793 RepID=A0AAD9GVV6_9STRA|nr:F-box protein MET30 [Phytophthora citrophthora]
MNVSTSRAIILHPLVAPVGGALSPEARVVAEWLRSLAPVQTAAEPKRSLNLLDFTCDENIHTVLSFLDGPSLCSARSVCRSWCRLSNDDKLWLNLCLQEFHVSPEQLTKQPESYQKLYQFACRSLKTLLRDYVHEQCLTNLQNSLRIPRAAAMTLIASRSV